MRNGTEKGIALGYSQKPETRSAFSFFSVGLRLPLRKSAHLKRARQSFKTDRQRHFLFDTNAGVSVVTRV